MKNRWIPILALLALPMLAACSDDDDVARATYQVTVYNLTEAQPLSPPVVVLHGAAYSAWTLGSPATVGLETLAEGGSGATLMTEANADAAVRTVEIGSAVVGPGASAQLTASMPASSDARLTVAAMLVNTNDGFTGVTGHDLSGLAVGESLMVPARVYDAGTEDNSETAATVPGPAGGGTGFDAARNDSNKVLLHGGVVSNQDGLPTSALTGNHKFDNPAMRIVVTRTG